MKEIWVLSVRTSLPNECCTKANLKTSVCAFASFEDARKVMRDTIKGFAFSENTMFDGERRITALNEYMDEMYAFDDEDECYDDFLTREVLVKIQDSFYSVFNGENCVLDIEENEYDDAMIGFKYDGESIVSYGCDDGPCNGYDPYIATNAFSMKEEKDYYIYIDDLLGQEYSSELYIDLKKVELN